MKNFLQFLIIAFLFFSCHKENNRTQSGCNMQQVYADNAKKVTITSGIWGTVSNIEGDCMPTLPPSTNSCKNCPVQRTIKIYQYTLEANATPSDNSPVFLRALILPSLHKWTQMKTVFFKLISLPDIIQLQL